MLLYVFFFSSRRRHTRYIGDWSSDVCSSDLMAVANRIMLMGGIVVPYEKTAQLRFERDHLATAIKTALERIQATGCVVKRSEERRVGKECRSRWQTERSKKKERE